MCAKMLHGYILVVYTLYTILLCIRLEAEGKLHHSKSDLIEMNRNLEQIPPGSEELTTLNVAYNHIEQLPALIFEETNYQKLRKLQLDNNRINNISWHAFKGLPDLKSVDLSFNNISELDPQVFKPNPELSKVVLVQNKIRFHRVQPFLMSHSIDTLILTDNKIAQIFEITFMALPNLKRLHLDGNELSILSQFSFSSLGKLNYLSLARTGVFQVSESMFGKVPRTVDLEDTPLAKTFTESLTKVHEESLRQLFRTLRNF